mgnify:FL=1
MSKVEALKKLAVVIGCATSVEEIKGTTIVEVLNFIVVNYPGSEQLGELTVTSTTGTSVGKTIISITPTLTGGNSYAYKTNPTSFDEPSYLDLASSYTAWNGTDEIEAEDSHHIAIVEVNSDNEIVKFGQTTVTSNLG